MTTPDLTEADALIMAAQCPIVRAAYASGDENLIAFAEKNHPAKRCDYVKQAHEKDAK